MTCVHATLPKKRQVYKDEMEKCTDEYVINKLLYHRDPEKGWMPRGSFWMASPENRLWHRMVVAEARRRGL